MARTQKFGIAFPCQIKSGKYLLDMNMTRADEVKSQLVHLIFTPEGQKLRDPLFGTKLIQYLFEPNGQQTWDDIVLEVKEKVRRYVSNCEVDNVEVEEFDDNRGLNVKLQYSLLEKDGERHNYELSQTI